MSIRNSSNAQMINVLTRHGYFSRRPFSPRRRCFKSAESFITGLLEKSRSQGWWNFFPLIFEPRVSGGFITRCINLPAYPTTRSARQGECIATRHYSPGRSHLAPPATTLTPLAFFELMAWQMRIIPLFFRIFINIRIDIVLAASCFTIKVRWYYACSDLTHLCRKKANAKMILTLKKLCMTKKCLFFSYQNLLWLEIMCFRCCRCNYVSMPKLLC